MSIALMTAVWRMDIAPTEKMVLLALADAANDDGVTWLAIRSKRAGKSDLITKTSLSERAIQTSIKRLCEKGLLHRCEKPGKGVIYSVLPPAADAPPPPQITALTPAGRAPESLKNHHVKPSKEPSFANGNLKAMVFVLEQVTGIDQNLHYGKLSKYASSLVKAGYSSEAVGMIYSRGGAWGWGCISCGGICFYLRGCI